MNKIVSASLAAKGKRNPNCGKYSSYIRTWQKKELELVGMLQKMVRLGRLATVPRFGIEQYLRQRTPTETRIFSKATMHPISKHFV